MTQRHKEHGQKLKSAYDSLEAKVSDYLAIKEKDQDSKHEKTRQQNAKSLDELVAQHLQGRGGTSHKSLRDEAQRACHTFSSFVQGGTTAPTDSFFCLVMTPSLLFVRLGS